MESPLVVTRPGRMDDVDNVSGTNYYNSELHVSVNEVARMNLVKMTSLDGHTSLHQENYRFLNHT